VNPPNRHPTRGPSPTCRRAARTTGTPRNVRL
jgi:hypothetical protein